jgi:deoxyadenosine/deoxycytidine kinase
MSMGCSYRQLYAMLTRELRPPDLVVYLRASVPTLRECITRWARPAERGIEPQLLASLERHYEAWVAGWAASPV